MRYNVREPYLLRRMEMRFILPVFLLALGTAGCNVINPPEKVPTYVRIDSFSFSDPSAPDITTHDITSAWVYFNNQIVGVFELPCNIPIITDAEGVVSINAGVNYTGYKASKVMYPFYTFDSFILAPQPGQVVVHNPKVRYNASASVKYTEDFETGSTFEPFNADASDDTSLMRTKDPSLVLGGKGGSGYIYLTPSNAYSENINNTDLKVKQGDAYIEIDYKCSVEFKVGLQTTSGGSPFYEPIAIIKPAGEWRKLYIGLQDFLGRYTSGTYRIVILASLPDGQSDGYVLVDNIKLISY